MGINVSADAKWILGLFGGGFVVLGGMIIGSHLLLSKAITEQSTAVSAQVSEIDKNLAVLTVRVDDLDGKVTASLNIEAPAASPD